MYISYFLYLLIHQWMFVCWFFSGFSDLFLNLILLWSIVALQCCVSFINKVIQLYVYI